MRFEKQTVIRKVGINREMKGLLIAGASGHGKVIADIATKSKQYETILFLDDDKNIHEVMSFPVIGTIIPDMELFVQWFGHSNIEIIIAIGNSQIRMKKQQMFEKIGMRIATLIHPSAVIGQNVVIGAGTTVMANTVINSGTKIGKGCIINTMSSVDHDNLIEDYVHISVGSHLAGTVSVGSHTWIGIGAIVSNNIKICEHCMIGAGAVVVKNILQKGVYIGIPARQI